MKLKHVKIENFRSIKHLEFTFPESGFLVLLGANNAGKSNVIRAINAICGEEWFGPEKMQDHDFYGRNRKSPLLIHLIFDNGSAARLSSSSKWPEYKDKHGNVIYSSKANIKEDYPCTYLGADRTFDRHMSFYDWTLLGKIRKSFHQRCAELSNQLDTKFGEIVELFDQVEGFSAFKADFARFFSEMQADTPLKMSVDFKPFTPSNYFKAMQILAADPTRGENDLDLEELGEGTRNLALLALLRSYAMNLRRAGEEVGGLLALEEPEIYLHPQAQRNLFRILRDIAASGIQVILSTHSSFFVDTEFFDSIGLVRKIPDPERSGCLHTSLTLVTKEKLVKHCIGSGVPDKKTASANISEYYKTTSNFRLNEAFFARFIILVEGETEELALPEYLQAAGLDCDMRGVSVVAVDGKNQIPKYWRLFTAFGVPLLVLFDNDDDGTEAKGNEKNKRKSNKNLAACFGLPLEQILHQQPWIEIESARLPRTPLEILRKDFETAVRVDYDLVCDFTDLDYSRLEQEAKDVIRPTSPGQGKGLIARYVARRLIASKPGYCPEFAKRIATIVNRHLGFIGPEIDRADDVPF